MRTGGDTGFKYVHCGRMRSGTEAYLPSRMPPPPFIRAMRGLWALTFTDAYPAWPSRTPHMSASSTGMGCTWAWRSSRWVQAGEQSLDHGLYMGVEVSVSDRLLEGRPVRLR